MIRFIVKSTDDTEGVLIFDTEKQITIAVGLAHHHAANIVTALNYFEQAVKQESRRDSALDTEGKGGK